MPGHLTELDSLPTDPGQRLRVLAELRFEAFADMEDARDEWARHPNIPQAFRAYTMAVERVATIDQVYAACLQAARMVVARQWATRYGVIVEEVEPEDDDETPHTMVVVWLAGLVAVAFLIIVGALVVVMTR